MLQIKVPSAKEPAAWAVSAATRAALPPSGLPNLKGSADLSGLALLSSELRK